MDSRTISNIGSGSARLDLSSRVELLKLTLGGQ